jgi:predicted CXXCH cytochrome family protein
MKRIIVVTMVVLAGVGLAATSQAVITGSKHDLHSLTAADGQICIACHTPHNADTTVTDAPLWNHTLPTVTYTLYASPTFNGAVTQPTGVSKLCLSCHDGTVAVDSFGGTTGTTMIATAGNLGTNLKKSHPISFTYNAALATADGELVDPATLPAGWVNGGKFECSSCHDVHNKNDFSAMLHIDNAASALCLTCHTK